MKRLTDRLCGALTLALLVALPGSGRAFHEGGVGYCEGCHVLHAPASATPGEDRSDDSRSFLIRGADASSTCLGCHAQRSTSYNVLSDDGSSYTPGGDFYWLEKTFTWDDAGPRRSAGERHGHNVVAADYGLRQDGVLAVAPGGAYPATALACTSCHDPHGRTRSPVLPARPIGISGSYGEPAPTGTAVGTYRLLAGTGYGSAAGGGFSAAAPVAVAPSPDGKETDANHAAYGWGMSEWCGNCHAGLLNGESSAAGRKHPAGAGALLGAAGAANYNAYVKTGDLSGTRGTSYLALVPFERGVQNASSLDPAATEGPDEGANVMCLTCHRAHASAFEHGGRWDLGATILADSHPRTGDGGAAAQDVRNSYYGRDVASRFGPYQRSLCAKCHPVD